MAEGSSLVGAMEEREMSRMYLIGYYDHCVVRLDGEVVYSTKDSRDAYLFMAQIKASPNWVDTPSASERHENRDKFWLYDGERDLLGELLDGPIWNHGVSDEKRNSLSMLRCRGAAYDYDGYTFITAFGMEIADEMGMLGRVKKRATPQAAHPSTASSPTGPMPTKPIPPASCQQSSH